MLIGKLVRLRQLEMTDLDRVYRWINDPDVREYLEVRYFFPLAAEEEWLRNRTKSPGSFDNVSFAIETLDGRHIGQLGFHETNAEDRKATLGIMIGEKDCWDHGFGTDATVTLLRFAFEEMNLARVMLHVDAGHSRAIAAYRKVGFVEEGRLRQDRYRHGQYWDTIVMGILREEFYTVHGGGEGAR